MSREPRTPPVRPRAKPAAGMRRWPGRIAGAACLIALCLLALACLWGWDASEAAAQTAAGSEVSGRGTLHSLVKSGFIGLIILLCSIIGVSLAITFAFQIRRDALVPPEVLGQIEQLFEDEDYEEAFHVCEANPSFLSAVLAPGLAKLEEGHEEMSKAMTDAGEIEATKLHQKVGFISLIASISPMLGLFGTVAGMIATFNVIADSPLQPKPKDLADGISIALGTTYLGLLVAIPMSVIYVIFRNRVINVVNEVGGIVEELLERFKPAK
jgi:biopolymer transport protein ExbB